MINYEKQLKEMLEQNEEIIHLLSCLSDLDLPFDYYVAAGCVANTVWNQLSGNAIDYGISDIDLVYYDKGNQLSEREFQQILSSMLKSFPYQLDIKNQANVHFWYEEKFGFAIPAYTSINEAIASWPTTATAVGVKMEKNDKMTMYAPYHLDDLFNMRIVPNKVIVTKEIYEYKARKWKAKWPNLVVYDW
ncbi:nucleotidyltransferase family protein [Cytobacillus sp. FSL W7-1323]|uniref:nucleotidyltransferase family protein n=1 Tax=Cytobacillus TaxID=2675230 RepID=UPI002B00080A|nr:MULTISPECIES: nucleotidyltransferase family protein [Cytobacillus]MEA1854933.1 nucleotidyltransferase family protein [Cytobacillus sp. OWB-43]MED1606190.1 nucleotidyltransferase family protein [Cytobacillus kochii]